MDIDNNSHYIYAMSYSTLLPSYSLYVRPKQNDALFLIYLLHNRKIVPIGSVLVYAPDHDCNAAHGAVILSIVMLSLISFGLPIAISFLFWTAQHFDWMERPRWAFTMGILNGIGISFT